MTQYLFSKPALLDETIRFAIEDNTFRSDDLEFTFAARVSGSFSAQDVACASGQKQRHLSITIHLHILCIPSLHRKSTLFHLSKLLLIFPDPGLVRMHLVRRIQRIS